jgi:hypothetical protein
MTPAEKYDWHTSQIKWHEKQRLKYLTAVYTREVQKVFSRSKMSLNIQRQYGGK